MPRILKCLLALLCFCGPLFLTFADPPSFESVVAAFRAKYASITDYQCRMVENCRKGSRSEERTMNIYFKKPRFIRMDILKGNIFLDAGTIGVYKNDGKVTGRKGGFLSLFAMTVDKHDPQATSVRGLAFDEIDMQAVLEKMEFHLSGSSDCAVTEGDGTYELACETHDPAANGGVTKDEVVLDAVSLLPLSTDSFEGNEHVQHAVWSSYVIDAGLPDKLFDVFWDPRQLTALGIQNISALPAR